MPHSPTAATAELRARLTALAEPAYRSFIAKLIPGAGAHILGVRIPTLRALAKELARNGAWQLPAAPGESMEEIMLRGMALGYARGLSLAERLAALERFVPHITNWSVCDSCCCTYSFARRHRAEVWEWLTPYLRSGDEFPARFGVVMLLQHFVRAPEWAERVAEALPPVPATAYYAEMAVAWCACEICLLYPAQKERLLSRLRPGVLRLTLRKIRESNRTDPREA